MTDWLATTWEASWRPFQYFNLYRLILACLALLAALWPQSWISVLHVADTPLFLPATGVYLLVVAVGFLGSIHWQHRFNFQLSSQKGRKWKRITTRKRIKVTRTVKR